MTDREFWIQVMMRYVERGWDVKDAATYTDLALEELKKRKFEEPKMSLEAHLRRQRERDELVRLGFDIYKAEYEEMKRSEAESRQSQPGRSE